jgi:protein-arginine kinase
MELNLESSLSYLQEIYQECKRNENKKMEYKKWIKEQVAEKYCSKVNITVKKMDILCEMAHRIAVLDYLKRIGWIEKDNQYISLVETNDFVKFMINRNDTLLIYIDSKMNSLEKNYKMFDRLNEWNSNLFDDGYQLDDELEKEYLNDIMDL